MTYAEIKGLALHFAQPLKLPLATLGGGVGALEAVNSMNGLLWSAAALTAFLLLMLRTILFFEFRSHERKEQRLYEAILITSQSFDTVTGSLRTGLEDVKKGLKEVKDRGEQLEALAAEHERRIKRIEESPLVMRMNLGLPLPPKPGT